MSKRMMVMVVAVAMGVLQPAFGPVLRAQAREGITVHGHWVIDVRNPDGTLSSHVEFENDLVPTGAGTLAMLLGRTASEVRGWTIFLRRNIGAPFGQNLFGIFPATIFEAAFEEVGTGLARFATLTATQVDSTVVLKGTATASAAGQINRVETYLTIANQTGSLGNRPFSGTLLANPVSLDAGQIVQVTVTLSFSSAG